MEALPIVFHSQGSKLHEVMDSAGKVPYAAIFVDYLQLIDTGSPKEYERVTAASSAFRDLAHHRNIFVMALTQMNREIDRVGIPGSPARYPKLADIRGSGQIEQDADAVFFLHPPDTSPDRDRTRIDAVIEKNRYGDGGIVHLKAVPQLGFLEESVSSFAQ
jgi:replicative DNA helicase